ncbi:SRPBCC family protein [Psychrobacillus sp. FSL K6-2684]|uniref:SRPBCC family protein n=1 Tax=Psychrobacillus faecigallinarum TaxID=2762235 RepID=A0ABR8R9P9_9BACI|nr:SRPBCC family protein [Psychrobacillus faecigallinarum]MBD7944536.1 SRPBCC family protein [Psychrobacillus faecigallinarum]
MPTIICEIFIDAPIDLCFDLSRDVTIHTKTTGQTKEKAVEGKTNGLLNKGDCVTWEATHFGIRQKLTAKIIEMEKPYTFKDVMVSGAFHSFTHTHHFKVQGTGTLVRDEFVYRSPLGILGKLADVLFLKRYMTSFLKQRSHELKRIAESQRIQI